MQYRIDPKSGNKLSALGLGCMRFPPMGRPDAATAERIIREAVACGINYLDVAYLYPGVEDVVGRALEHAGLRSRVHLATKLPHSQCKTLADVEHIFAEQLERLRTDYVDYYLIHNVTTPSQWQHLVDLGIEQWIAERKAEGSIRQIGFSFHGGQGAFAPLLDAYAWDFCQIQYNYANERFQAGTKGLLDAAARGMAVFVMEPLLGGKLAGKLPPQAKAVFAQARTSMEPAEWALRWVWNHPEVTMLLSGMTSPEQVRANAAVAEYALAGSMGAEDLAVIDQVKDVFDRTNKVPCTGCAYCMPCPKGVNIPDCFAAYNASFAHGRFIGIQQYVTASSALTERPNLITNCVRCGACTKRCPQGIDIPRRLTEARRRLQPAPLGAAFKLARKFTK